MRLFHGGRIAREESADLLSGDVLVDDRGRIERIGEGLETPSDTEEVDCTGLILVPGMFDLNVHSRDPGATDKEDLESCAAAAINGGITGLALAPDTSPVVDSGNQVRSILEMAASKCPLTVVQLGAITRGNEGRELAAIGGMAEAGAPMITDATNAVSCPDLLKRAMEYAREFDIPIASLGEVAELSRGRLMNDGAVAYRLGLPGIPSISEEIGIDRNVRIAKYTGARLHVQQVSTRESARILGRAREEGLDVTSEVSPHHLIFDEEDVGAFDTRYKTNPPLRTEADRDALVQALIDGRIDVIATNHSPHSRYDKATDFASAPFGITGLDTAVVSLFDRFIDAGVFGWDLLIRRFSSTPRQLVGLPPVSISEGERADFFAFDPNGSSTFSRERMKSKSTNTPFLDRTLAGRVCLVNLGEQLYRNVPVSDG